MQWPTDEPEPDAMPWIDWNEYQYNHNGIMNISPSQHLDACWSSRAYLEYDSPVYRNEPNLAVFSFAVVTGVATVKHSFCVLRERGKHKHGLRHRYAFYDINKIMQNYDSVREWLAKGKTLEEYFEYNPVFSRADLLYCLRRRFQSVVENGVNTAYSGRRKTAGTVLPQAG